MRDSFENEKIPKIKSFSNKLPYLKLILWNLLQFFCV